MPDCGRPEHRGLPSVCTFDKALHFAPQVMRYWLNVYRSGCVYIDLRFYTAWVVSGLSEEA